MADTKLNENQVDIDLSSYLQNNATDSTSIVVNNKNEVISSKKTTVIGNNASTTVGYAVVIGDSAEEKSKSLVGGIAIGQSSISYSGISIGMLARNGYGVAIGQGYNSNSFVEASSSGSIAIGIVTSSSPADRVKATADDAIQLGKGVNANAKTFQVYEYQLLDGNTGLIPPERLGTGYDATKTQVLKHVNGVLTWVDEA